MENKNSAMGIYEKEKRTLTGEPSNIKRKLA
jgi:hypothetical protein